MNRLVLLIILCAVAGCGSQTYRNRLERTSRYYRYLEKLDANLESNRWRSEGVSFRVPKQFELVPYDEQQPDGRNPAGRSVMLLRGIDSLEGMLGRWQCKVEIGGRDEPLDAYMFVAANVALQDDPRLGRQASENFEKRFLEKVYATVAPGEPLPEQNTWKEKQFPATGSFADPIPYTVFKLRPTSPYLGLSGDYELSIYSHSSGGVQVVVLFFIPSRTVTNEHLSEDQRIGMCLQTLKISGGSPSSGAAGGAPRRKAPPGSLDF